MPTKVTINGRVWKSRDWREQRRPTAEDIEALNAPPIVDAIPDAPRVLEEDGVRYRIVEELDPAQGWCLASQLIEHFEIDWPELRRWALEGLLDCATRPGSGVRRYRPVAPTTALLTRAAAYQAGQPPKRPQRGSVARPRRR